MGNLTHRMKRGDLAPPFRAQVLDGTTAVSLETATSARLILKRRSGAVVLDEALTIEDQDDNPGWVNYQWQAGDTDTTGEYLAEVEVTWGDGSPQTFPASGYAVVRVTGDLD